MPRSIRSLTTLALLAAGLVAPVHASDWGISLSKHRRNASVALHFGTHGSGIKIVRGSGRSRCCTFQAGHYETRRQRAWVPATCKQVWVPARYETRYSSCGLPFQALVRPGHYEKRTIGGIYEFRTQRVWVPGRRVCTHGVHRW